MVIHLSIHLCSVTRHMGSHSVKYHLIQVNTPHLSPSQRPVLDLPVSGRMEGGVDLGDRYIPRWFTRPQTVTHPSTAPLSLTETAAMSWHLVSLVAICSRDV